MCGIVGIVSHRPVNQALYDALMVLQHRGQDAAGIMTDWNGTLCTRKKNGLVSDVFHAAAHGRTARQYRYRPLPLSDRRYAQVQSRPSPSTSIRRMASPWRTTAT